MLRIIYETSACANHEIEPVEEIEITNDVDALAEAILKENPQLEIRTK